MTFAQRLRSALDRGSLCVGLDPDLSLLPPPVKNEKNPLLSFNRAIVEATADLAVAYKPNLAFYEAQGRLGWDALYGTVETIRKHAPNAVIVADAKRGDIGNTAELYARSIFKDLACDAVTLHPYMGFDSIEPFIRDDNFGAFILCLTSNSGSSDFQRLPANGKPLYRHVAEQVLKWDRHGNCGLVVGATQPEAMAEIRASAGSMPFLVPGVGAQGGDLAPVVRINRDGSRINALINASRSILYASNGSDFAEAARQSAITMNESILRAMA